MNKLLVATLPLLLIGGAAATALALREQEQVRAAPRIQAPAPPRGRISVTPAQLREAFAAGLIDRPIKTILMPFSCPCGIPSLSITRGQRFN